MRPKHLVFPFHEGSPQPVLYDRILYVPGLGELKNVRPLNWADPSLFGNNNPIHIEYCSGNGAWIVAKAVAHPQINWIAVERKFTRVRKIWSKIKNFNIPNLFVISGEALKSTVHYFESERVSHIYINFPDPWPKQRHLKNRLFTDEFLEQMHRILIKGGSVTLVTDDAPFSEWSIRQFQNKGLFSSKHAAPYFSEECPNYGTSYFEELWRSKGKSIRYHLFGRHTDE